MKKEFFKYIKSYSVDPEKVNRIIVSNFLHSNNISKCKNVLIDALQIKKGDSEFEELEKLIDHYSISSLEDLVEVFEFVISPEEKIVTGAVYTPKYIRKYIIDRTIDSKIGKFNNYMVCDPACGCSGFLLSAAKKIKELSGLNYSTIFRNNLFGLDIQEFSIRRSEILLSLASIIDGEDPEKFDFNLYIGNALNFDWSLHISNFTGFDSIVGNPPYVCSRNIEGESRDLILNWSVSRSGHPDLYIPFFEIGITNLKPEGLLGYITMNTFFKSVNGRALREYFQHHRFLINILDFGSHQIFDTKSTYTCICIIKKSTSSTLNYIRVNNIESIRLDYSIFQSINYKDLDAEKGWNLQEREILNKIEKTGIPLGKKFISRNGIATLKNDIYIFDPIQENSVFYFLQNGQTYPIERDICLDIVNPNKLTKENSIDPLRKKVIFPYYFENGQPKILSEEYFIKKYPNAYYYLLANKETLALRDKGKGRYYESWYAYGRNQSLDRYKFKLFFPHIAPSIPNYVINEDPNLLFVNGIAIIGKNEQELQLLKKIMSSRLFWFYVLNSSKPYGSGYYSLSRNYIKNFGIFDFTKEQIKYIINSNSQEEVDAFLEGVYDIDFTKTKITVVDQ